MVIVKTLVNKIFISVVIASLTLTLTFNCKKEVPKVIPSISTSTPTNITGSTATCGGTISSVGSAPVTSRGVCWGINQSPTTSDNKTSDGSGVGSFTSSISGLSSGVTYNVRAYATNSVGTAYGNQVTFNTAVSLPTISTTSATEITATTATSGGNITNDGGAAVTSRGVCWNTNGNPTIMDSKTSDGYGIGIFVSDIIGLSQNQTYFIRAYATNINGTYYGDQIQTKTLTSYISKSPTYKHPNTTSGEIISNLYWPVNQLKGKQIAELMPNIPEGLTFENAGVTFLDIKKDGILDLAGYLPDPNPNAGKVGKCFILIDVFGKKELSLYPTKLSVVPRYEINDYNGDGILDLLAISSNSHQNADGISIDVELPYIFWFFNADGTFKEEEIGEPWSEHDVASGDIDNDGDIDLLSWGFKFPSPTPFPKIYLNTGGGKFEMRLDLIKEIDNKYFNSMQSLAHRFFDLDNDGNLDLIAGCNFDKKSVDEFNAFPYSIYWGDGTGSYKLYSKRTELPTELPEEIKMYNFLVMGMNILDYDNDVDLDIVTSTTKREYDGYYIQLLENKGNRVFEDVTLKMIDKPYEISPIKNLVHMFYRIRIVDYDNDGDYDIVPIQQHLDNLFLNTFWEYRSDKFYRRD